MRYLDRTVERYRNDLIEETGLGWRLEDEFTKLSLIGRRIGNFDMNRKKGERKQAMVSK